jgi:DNA-binding FadR family transcriptional regulator
VSFHWPSLALGRARWGRARWGRARWGAAFEFGAELIQLAGDEGVRAGTGLDPAGEVTAAGGGRVSRGTARRAVAVLRDEALVLTIAQRGTYVVPADDRGAAG